MTTHAAAYRGRVSSFALAPTRRAAFLLALVLGCLLAFSSAQAHAATLYWADASVGSVQIDDAAGAPVDGSRNDSASTGCVGNYSWTANSTAVYANNGDAVCRRLIDGSPAEPSWVNAGCSGDESQVSAVYATEEHVYYMCLFGGRLGRVDVDGTHNVQSFGTASGNRDYAYRLTADANWVYASGGGQIRRYPIDGGPMDATWSISAGDVRGLDVDSRHIYWSTADRHYINRANLDGSGVDTTWINAGDSFGDGVWGVTVTGSSIYWMTRAYGKPYPGTIGRANIDGTNVVDPFLDNVAAASQNHQVIVVGGTAKTPLSPGPTSTGVPSLSGTVVVGEVVTATAGDWSAAPDQVVYQWQVSSDSGATWTAAPGAGAQTANYTIALADIGKQLRVSVRAGSNGQVLTTATSSATSAVPAPAAPVNTAPPTWLQHGLMLIADPGTWTNSVAGDPSFAYQWQVSATGDDGSWVDAMGPGNATSAYLEQGIEAGTCFMRVRVTASNGSDAVAYSATVRAPALTAPLGLIYLKTFSVMGDGFGRTDYTNPGGVWGFSSNGTTNVWAGWNDLYAKPVGGESATSLASYGYGAQSGVLVDSQYIYFPLGGSIQRMDLDGSNRDTSFIPGVNYPIYYMARDRHYLYWRSGNDVLRAPIAGGPVDADWRAHFDHPVQSVAVDGDYIYATRQDSLGYVSRADISGSGVENAWVRTDFRDFQGMGIDRNGLYVKSQSGSCVGLVYIALDGAASRCVIQKPGDDSYAISVVPDPSDAGALPVKSPVDAPEIEGTASSGATLTVSHGTWSNTPASYTYRWLVSDDGASNWSAATGASGTQAAYVIPEAYLGKHLKARVIAHNGSTWSEPAYSDPVWVPAPPSNAGGADLPSITGDVELGATLTASTGTWSYPPASDSGYAYAWEISADGADGWSSATGEGHATSAYIVPMADLGKHLRVVVTADNGAGVVGTASSPVTSAVDWPLPSIAVEGGAPLVPTIAGDVSIGSSLTASPGTWRYGAPSGYRWQTREHAPGAPWSDATGDGADEAVYTVSPADSGLELRVAVTAGNATHSATAYSAATEVVPATPWNAGGDDLPQVSGSPVVGQVLTATHGTWSNPPASESGYTYTWEVSDDGETGWEPARGAGRTTARYTVAVSDDERHLRVVVTADNGIGALDAASDSTTAVGIPAPRVSVAPRVTGTVEIGGVLTASSGTWTYATLITYVWQTSADGETWIRAEGDGASTSRYVVAAADAGRLVRVRVTGANRVDAITIASATTTRVPGPAGGLGRGDERGAVVLKRGTKVSGLTILTTAGYWIRSTSRVSIVGASLPRSMRIVSGRLVASARGSWTIRVRVNRADGTRFDYEVDVVVY